MLDYAVLDCASCARLYWTVLTVLTVLYQTGYAVLCCGTVLSSTELAGLAVLD